MTLRLVEYLWTRTGPPPFEYTRYQLRMMYHCPPSVLDEQRGPLLFEMLRDLKCASWEAKVARQRR